jgi:uncharacterized protein (TIGR03118 family)
MKKLTSLAGRPFRFGLLTVSLTSAGLLADTASAQQYQQTNLVSNSSQSGVTTVDPSLVNPWGIARSSVGPWWVSDEGKGVATIFDGSGKPAPPVLVTIPSAGQAASGSPTGIVFNGSSDFAVESGKPAIFIFATFDGTIAGWNPQANPTVAIQKVQATPGSVLTGATIAQSKGQNLLYVTDIHEGQIRVFDTNFSPVKLPSHAFRDDHLSNKFVPFNVQNIGGNLYVAFAHQNAAKNFVTVGANLGTVDVFSPEGDLLLRLERGTWFNAPWGLVQASTDFGTFSHSIIVGQFGSGEILAFDAVTGQFQGKLEDQNSNAISIPGLWGLAFGAGNANSGAPNQLFFNAGIGQGKAGLFGFFSPVAADLTQGNDQ